MAVRDVAKGEALAETLPGTSEVRHLDLTSLASVRQFAASWSGQIDVLVNNAGVMYAPRGRTADGFELHIATNHLGHFALTNLLLPFITDRVVTITSIRASAGKIDLDDLNWENRRYNSSQAYADSKQANILFTSELQRRLTQVASRVRAVSAHPGLARTNLIRTGGIQGTLSRLAVRLIAQDAERGALDTLFAATKDIPGNSLVGPDGVAQLRGYPQLLEPPASSRHPELASRLWGLSARLTKTDSSLTRSVV
jgi:NAD(P)-dependent dehydrogenase (short-subunit alcohol dehydrogenase family)